MHQPDFRVLCLTLAAVLSLNPASTTHAVGDDLNASRIQPWEKNPRYWQYKGEPLMLLGGSKTDHIFLIDNLEAHLDEMHSVGANYVRCTMSQREEKGLKPYKLLSNGKFDLDQWNDEYWERFRNMLKWTAERDIIVQIEVWDRFDYYAAHWQGSPWRPANNVNYTVEQAALADTYNEHPANDKQPFFHTVPGMPRYQKKLDLIHRNQERFVDRMLSDSLEYDHVLYCMNNETSTPPEWGQYWIRFIKERAKSKGVQVCTSDMFDDAFGAIARDGAGMVEVCQRLQKVLGHLAGSEHLEVRDAAIAHQRLALKYAENGMVLEEDVERVWQAGG